MKRFALSLLLPLLVAACGKEEAPPPPPPPPPPKPAPAPAPAPEPPPPPAPEPAPAPEPPPGPALKMSKTVKPGATTGGEHTVGKGETLYSIAKNAGVSVADLAAWNGLADPTRIKAGQVLRLSAPGAAAKAPEASGATHKVAKGETLYSIAKAAGRSVDDLAAWNGLADPTQIKVGQELRLTAPDK